MLCALFVHSQSVRLYINCVKLNAVVRKRICHHLSSEACGSSHRVFNSILQHLRRMSTTKPTNDRVSTWEYTKGGRLVLLIWVWGSLICMHLRRGLLFTLCASISHIVNQAVTQMLLLLFGRLSALSSFWSTHKVSIARCEDSNYHFQYLGVVHSHNTTLLHRIL